MRFDSFQDFFANCRDFCTHISVIIESQEQTFTRKQRTLKHVAVKEENPAHKAPDFIFQFSYLSIGGYIMTESYRNSFFELKGYSVQMGYMGYVAGEYMLFASEEDYREYMED